MQMYLETHWHQACVFFISIRNTQNHCAPSKNDHLNQVSFLVVSQQRIRCASARARTVARPTPRRAQPNRKHTPNARPLCVRPVARNSQAHRNACTEHTHSLHLCRTSMLFLVSHHFSSRVHRAICSRSTYNSAAAPVLRGVRTNPPPPIRGVFVHIPYNPNTRAINAHTHTHPHKACERYTCAGGKSHTTTPPVCATVFPRIVCARARLELKVLTNSRARVECSVSALLQ